MCLADAVMLYNLLCVSDGEIFIERFEIFSLFSCMTVLMRFEVLLVFDGLCIICSYIVGFLL